MTLWSELKAVPISVQWSVMVFLQTCCTNEKSTWLWVWKLYGFLKSWVYNPLKVTRSSMSFWNHVFIGINVYKSKPRIKMVS